MCDTHKIKRNKYAVTLPSGNGNSNSSLSSDIFPIGRHNYCVAEVVAAAAAVRLTRLDSLIEMLNSMGSR